jgi:hypothetical protein
MGDRIRRSRGWVSRPTVYWLTMVLLISFLAGCAFRVKLVGEYDEITDRTVSDLHRKTVSFFARLNSSSGHDVSYEANRSFYEDAQGDVSTLILRAKVTEEGLKRNPLTRNFEDLQKQYQDLAELHKTSPSLQIMRSAEDALQRSFRAIVENLMYLKWNQHQPRQTK